MAFRLAARRGMLTALSRLKAVESTRISALQRCLQERQHTLPAACSAACQRPWAVGRPRSFAVSAVSSQGPTQDLLESLDTEIKYEAENNNTVADDIDPPGDWVLTDKPGSSLITLTRRHEGEQILVEFSVTNQPPELPSIDEDEEAGNGQPVEPQVDVSVNFEATIIKGDKALMFDLTSDGSYVEVNHVSLGAAEGELDEDSYDGPVYSELDEDVQQKFQTFLEERGVNDALGEYLLAAADAKEQREYARWLGDVRKFVSG